MNTVTLSETTAIAAAVAVATGGAAAVAASQELLLIPLSQLRPSNRNVRKSGGVSIPELASSIARVGLLQNLTVVAAPDGEHYEVVAGRRRLAALKLLVKRHKLDKHHAVHCLLVLDDAARTVSLTENVQREAMSPIEELFAWKDLAAEGRPVEDIAADFGVTPLVVQRRLKLANVSPRLLADFDTQAVTLEQLMALAITDDHAAQEAAFYESPQWQRNPEALRDHLTSEEIDASRDAVARFVGQQAYEQADGGIRRDLFADEKNGIFLTDGALLESLARDKLAATVEQVSLEGWAWVDAAPRVTSADLYQFQRARSTRRDPNKTEAKRMAKLEAQQAKLQDRVDDEDDMSDEQTQALEAEMDALGDELEAIERGLMEYPSAVVALAGAVVSVDAMGAIVVHRGLLREEQVKALRTQEQQDWQESGTSGSGPDAGAAEPAKPGISEKLAKRLSAHRTGLACGGGHLPLARVARRHQRFAAKRARIAGPGHGAVTRSHWHAGSPPSLGRPTTPRPGRTVYGVTGLLAAGTAVPAGGVRRLHGGRRNPTGIRHTRRFAGASGGIGHARLVDTNRSGLLRACIESQGTGSSAGVRTGAGQPAGQAQEGRDGE
jgi:ParB family chromosome partitioning protein